MKLKLRAFLPLLLLLLTAITGHATDNWKPDILRQGYEMRTVDQGRDYSGPVVSTIIRRLLPDTVTRPLGTILYIHGFNDYFFNPELGQQANRHGYDFYAVDLRKYGRSIRPRQELFQCRIFPRHRLCARGNQPRTQRPDNSDGALHRRPYHSLLHGTDTQPAG